MPEHTIHDKPVPMPPTAHAATATKREAAEAEMQETGDIAPDARMDRQDGAAADNTPFVTAEPDLVIERLSLKNGADCDAVIKLWYDGELIEESSTAKEDLQNCYESGRGSVLIARRAAKRPIIATVMVGHDGKSGWVHYLAVAKSLRGQGHGAVMLEMAENILSHVGLPKCRVHAATARAAKFYRRQGYRLTTAPVRSSHGDDDRYYEKRLSS
ncbi:GNAT family N-acetyltransferase [Thalassospira marina]|uniref:N-acetyltransferase domain-containing protein n=1 Tax=Thalassospira marina TaxID=2048283 RepID=A0A2N3KEK2_9PROT|nr:GNAT family N-acetyltransferase [Thalassospira marina]PKR48950.1 hypothetical protein COO20_23655 [Thalassospira marina]